MKSIIVCAVLLVTLAVAYAHVPCLPNKCAGFTCEQALTQQQCEAQGKVYFGRGGSGGSGDVCGCCPTCLPKIRKLSIDLLYNFY